MFRGGFLLLADNVSLPDTQFNQYLCQFSAGNVFLFFLQCIILRCLTNPPEKNTQAHQEKANPNWSGPVQYDKPVSHISSPYLE